jgi:branched-chain amino acid transport system substrate-binding protein
MERRDSGRQATRWLAALAAALLVGGCGTRLDDSVIENAASRVITLPSGQAAPVAGDSTGGAVAAGEAGNVADQAAADASQGATPVVAGGGTAAAGKGPTASGSSSATAPVGAATAGGTGSARASAGGGAGGAKAADGPSAGAAPAAGGNGVATPGAPGATPAVATGSTIVIGNVGDYSGIVGSVLHEGAPMAQVVARHVNDTGGLNGHPVKMLVADAAGDPSRALSIVRDMVENKGVVAFMGNLWVLSASGARSYLEQKRIPAIGGDVATATWFQSPMFFPQASSFPTMAVGSVKTMADLGFKKIALGYCAEVEACKIYHDEGTARAASVGGQIVYTAQVSLAQPDYTAECLQAQRSGAQALMLGVDSTALSRFARSCFQQGFKVPIVTASLATIASTTKDPNLEGLLSPVGTFPFVANDVPAEREYAAAIARYAPTIEQSGSTSAVWVSGALLREVSRSLPATVTSADFLKGLYQIKNNTLGGIAPPLTFIEGKPAPDFTCYFIQKIVGGKFTAPQGSKQTCL